MPINDLYELIRKDQVLLWVGSGFSFYAGFPSVNEIKTLLNNAVSPAKQKELDLSKDLIHFSEDFVVQNGRAFLERVIQERFKTPPIAEHVHQQLGLVSHFKRIITTNYDELLENNFPPRTAALTTDNDVIGTSQAKVKIYKIHGDIKNGKSLVVTATDYSKMYNRNFKDPFWAAVIHEISLHHVLFLGYGYEDENIWADFDHIESKLKSKTKKRFMVGPPLPALKKKRLKKLGIGHIELYGEDFVTGLIANIKENVVADHKQGFTDTQTAQDFITGFDMQVKIEATKEMTEIVSLQKVSGPTKHTINFASTDTAFIDSYKQFSNSYASPVFKFTAAQLNEFSFLIEDFKFMGIDDIAQFNIMHESRKGKVKIVFPEDKLAIENVCYEVFSGIPGKLLIKLDYQGFTIAFDLEIQEDGGIKIEFSTEEPEHAPAKQIYINYFQAMYYLFFGKKIEIHQAGHPVQAKQFQYHEEAGRFKKLMERYLSLVQIEKKFKVKLPPVSIYDFTDEDKKAFNKLSALVKYGYHSVKDPEGLTIADQIYYSKMIEELKEMEPGTYLSIESKISVPIKLLNEEIILGREQILLLNPQITKTDEKAFSLTLIPDNQILIYHYEKTGFFNFEVSQILL
jgi:hypothetical protein